MATILVVEDHVVWRRLIQDVLLRHGYDVVMARGSQEALQKIEGRTDIQAATVDVIMRRELAEDGRMEGVALCKELAGRGIPVVVVSVRATEDIGHRCTKEAGAFAYITKAFDETNLAATIARALQSDRSKMRG